MSREILTIPQRHGAPLDLPVARRLGAWALVRHRYGYTVYHAPEGLDPQSVPDRVIDPQLITGRTFLGYRPGLAALADIAQRFPDFERSADSVRALKEFLERRGGVQ